jgi:hypothetical protein
MGEMSTDGNADGKEVQVIGGLEAALIAGPVLEEERERVAKGNVQPHLAEGGEDPVLSSDGKGASHLGSLLAENRWVGTDPPFTLERKGTPVEGAGEDEKFMETTDLLPA